MARSTSASCTPPGSGNSACFPRPARSATRTTTPWPKASTARTRPSWCCGASHSPTWPSQNWRRSGGSRGGTRSVSTSRWAAGHRNRSKPSIMQTKRHKPSHNKRGTEIRPLQAASSRSSCSAATDSTYTYHNQEPNPRKQQKPLNSSIPLQRSHHGIRTPTRVCVHDSSNEPYPPLDGRLQYRDAMR